VDDDRFGCRYARVSVSRLSSLRDGVCQPVEGSTCQSQNTRCSFAGCSIKVFVNNKKKLDGNRRSPWTILCNHCSLESKQEEANLPPSTRCLRDIGQPSDEHTESRYPEIRPPTVGLDVAVGSALSNQGEGFYSFLSATVVLMAPALSDRGRPIYYRQVAGKSTAPSCP
jgi:hypothetical protein